VGATCAQRIIEKGYADIVLVDIINGLPQGKALDIMESAPMLNFNTRIIGSNSYEETAGSDVVVITSGLSRKPGMTRDQLLATNTEIVGDVVSKVVSHSPDCVIIVVTNPADAMTHLALKKSGFSRNRVFGLSGALDSSRLASFIAAELKAPVEDISVCVIGQHGNNMVVIPRLSTVNSKPITELLPQETINRLVQRTVNAGAEIVELLKTGSAFYAPSAAVARMLGAIILDEKKVLPCSACLDGEYGLKDVVLGIPVKLGKNGIEEIIELELTTDEKKALHEAAEVVRGLVKGMGLV
jgi:malate dehydrogenase